MYASLSFLTFVALFFPSTCAQTITTSATLGSFNVGGVNASATNSNFVPGPSYVPTKGPGGNAPTCYAICLLQTDGESNQAFITGAKCSMSDVACQCGNLDYIGHWTSCIKIQCPQADAAQALGEVEMLCPSAPGSFYSTLDASATAVSSGGIWQSVYTTLPNWPGPSSVTATATPSPSATNPASSSVSQDSATTSANGAASGLRLKDGFTQRAVFSPLALLLFLCCNFV